MDFFDKLGKKASDAYKVTADKTGKIAKEAKLKMKINELKSEINDIYKQIGEIVYQKHVREEDINIKNELEEQCTKIDVLSSEIESNLQETLHLKDKKQCLACYKEIDKEFKYCPECGKKQSEEDLNSQIEHDEDIDKRDINNANLEKTIAVESDIEVEERNEVIEDE